MSTSSCTRAPVSYRSVSIIRSRRPWTVFAGGLPRMAAMAFSDMNLTGPLSAAFLNGIAFSRFQTPTVSISSVPQYVMNDRKAFSRRFRVRTQHCPHDSSSSRNDTTVSRDMSSNVRSRNLHPRRLAAYSRNCLSPVRYALTVCRLALRWIGRYSQRNFLMPSNSHGDSVHSA